MATVYLAEDLKHHRQVAIKVLDPELARALGAERFLREVEVTAKLTHPHILTLIDSGEVAGFLYYVMPYIEGETLRERMNREGQLPLDDALQITKEVAVLADATGTDVRAALLRLDSVMRPFPVRGGAGGDHELMPALPNLVLAQRLAQYGEAQRALGASRRRTTRTGDELFHPFLPEYLRQEGDLAAMVGDTAGAIEAYQHYLALREDPDPPWRAQWDSVRVELAALAAQ
jgi:hypothetical protein